MGWQAIRSRPRTESHRICQEVFFLCASAHGLKVAQRRREVLWSSLPSDLFTEEFIGPTDLVGLPTVKVLKRAFK